MSRTPHFTSRRLIAAIALALGASGAAFADDNSMSRFGGSSYAYFGNAVNASAVSTWRQDHPRGLTDREFQAFSSSDLSAVVAQVDAPIVAAAAPANIAWRQSHPNGFTERELLSRSSSTLAAWQVPGVSAPGPRVSIAEEEARKEKLAAALQNFLRPRNGSQTQ